MYFVCLIVLFLSVYITPALAFFPTLIRQPHTLISIPIISSLIVVILVSLLLPLKLFNHYVVVGLSVLFVCVAIVRSKNIIQFKFNNTSKLLLFNLLLMLPFFVKLGTHSFDQGDEIYSWNFWAIQHYLSLPPDFTHTGAPYPQFLPKLLAYQYQLLGSIDYQLPIKCLLGVFSFTLLNTLAVAYGHRDVASKIKYGILILWIVFGIGLQHFFNDGYADPIMCASLVLSVYYAWLAYKNNKNKYWLLAIATGLVSAYAKQPGLLWLGFVLPAGYVLFSYSHCIKNKLKSGLFILATSGMALLWAFTEGMQFQNNGGVIGASLKNRDILGHLNYLAEFYFIQQPLLGLFLLFSVVGLIIYFIKAKKHKLKNFILFIFSFLILPYLLLWFTFGAYQLRLGQHVIALLSLLIILSGYRILIPFPVLLPNFVFLSNKIFKTNTKIIFLALTTVSVLGSLMIGYKQEYKVMKGIGWHDGGLRTLQFYFPDAQKIIADELYKKTNITVWVPTRYLYGIFYSHTNVVMPEQYNWGVQDLIKAKPDYIITAAEEVTGIVWVERLQGIIQGCPLGFIALNSGQNRFKYVAYRVNKDNLDKCYPN